jgi:hypothetical protein
MVKKKLSRGDRLQLTIKNFGRTVEIYSPRGKINPHKSKDGKTITIQYEKSRPKKSPLRKVHTSEKK